MTNVYRELDSNFGLATDLYELTMAQAYFDRDMEGRASFSLFIRTLPRDWGFFVFAGIDDVLAALESFRYSTEALEYLESTRLFSRPFLDYLADFRFRGEVVALEEGEIFFPGEPLLEVSASMIEAQVIETAVINRASFPTLITSKATRSVLAAPDRRLVDFSARRTQGLEAGMTVARSSYLAGFAGTSNVLAAKIFGMPAYGTMAHSFVASFDEEIESFRAFVASFPEQSVVLVDTYDTLAGVENAIRIGRELEARGYRLRGIRLDSGDLMELSRRSRALLDAAGIKDATIVASGGLDEHKVAALVRDGAPIDVFGIGTDLGVARDAPSLDIAYKLVEYAGKDRLKLSAGKETLPGRKQIYRRFDAGGIMREDLIAGRDEEAHAGDRRDGGPWGPPLLARVMAGGERVRRLPGLTEARKACEEGRGGLPAELIRLRDPSAYPVRLSAALEAHRSDAAGMRH